MPWYKVPVTVVLQAADGERARQEALSAFPGGVADDEAPFASASYPAELDAAAVRSHLGLRAILRQADADRAGGLFVSDGRHPGVRFSPQAAGALAALEAEEMLRDPPPG